MAHPDSATDKFQQAAATGNGPDIFIWAHDRLGEWAQSGLISPITPSAKAQGEIEDFAWEAVTYGGKLWGYPMAVESIGLLYNKALVPTPPASFDEVLALNAELAKSGKRAILWDYNNTYFTWPLLSAKGGYVFEQTDGGYNVKSTGVNNAGAKAGAKVLRELIERKITVKARLTVPTSSVRATLIHSLRTPTTPNAVLSSIGHTEQMKITKIAEVCESLITNSANGIQASGEIGRRIWMKGLRARYISGDMPMTKPMGIATSAASRLTVSVT